MGAVDIIVIALIALIIGAATFYIIRSKRRGQKCIGCPYANSCTKCNCGKNEDDLKV